MKKVLLFLGIIALVPFSSFAGVTKEMVVEKVKMVCNEVKAAANPQDVFNKITSGAHPYKDKSDPAFYAFVYDDAVRIVAHPKKKLVGKSYKGKPDIRGKMFRDKIVEGAIKKGQGWVKYTYQKPGQSVEQRKKTYYELCPNKGKNYVVACGMYDE